MNPVIAGWATVADEFGQRLDAVTAEQWNAATPCDDWTVRQVVEHAVEVQQRVGSAIGADTSAGLGDDPAAGWAVMRQQIQDKLMAEGTLEMVIETPFGERPVAEALGIPMNDLLIHTWDVSRAIGASEALPEQIVAHAYAALQPLEDMLRQSGRFGPAVEVADDVDLQTKFIAFTGRRP